jgi:hypothetical protein
MPQRRWALLLASAVLAAPSVGMPYASGRPVAPGGAEAGVEARGVAEAENWD